MNNKNPNKSFKEAIIKDWKNTWDDRGKRFKFIFDSVKMIIFVGVTLSWLFYSFEPAMNNIDSYQKLSNHDPIISFYANLGTVLPLLLYYVIGDYYVGKCLIKIMKRFFD